MYAYTVVPEREGGQEEFGKRYSDRDTMKESVRRSQTRWLCFIHGLRCFGDRSWSFFLPVFLSLQSNSSIETTAILKFCQTVAVILFSASASRTFEFETHKNAATRLLFFENISVVLGGAILLTIDAGKYHPLFWIGMFFMSVDAVCSSVLSVVTEKDWVVQACKDDQSALTFANALIARVDLGVSIASYLVMGWVMTWMETRTLLVWLAAWHVVSALIIWTVITHCLILQEKIPYKPSLAPNSERESSSYSSMVKGYAIFKKLPTSVQLVMCGFMLVWMTVLSPGELVTAWLVSIDTDMESIALFRAASQAIGCVSTIVAPMIIESTGAMAGTVVGVLLQVACLLLSLPAIMLGRADVLMLGIAASRLGLWTFDLSERQVVQTFVGGDDRALVFNWERSVCNGAALFALMFSIVLSDVSQFWILATFSVAVVAVAATFVVIAFGKSGDHKTKVVDSSPVGDARL
eukprot:m.94749 g.94749  ORF g.94749 m.94749 type:complete len:465 (+) comp26752_c0_seq4:174-1568(+)